MSEGPITGRDHVCLVRVRLQPGASRDRIEGLGATADGLEHLKARVRAVPEKGKANAALEKLIAKTLRMPKSSVSVIKGGTERIKTVRVETPDTDMHQLLNAFLEASK